MPDRITTRAAARRGDMFKRLDDITDRDRPLAGGKAVNCARLRRAGFPLPDGIVVLSDAVDAEIPDLSTDGWLDRVGMETRFAVRSSGIGEDSAGHSFAGVHDTRLNVDRADLTAAVRACRRSADSLAARAYRQARAIADTDARIAVLVQIMVPAVTSGVAFTVNPITGADEIVINAARGLGEALVSGLIDPDEYRIGKGDGVVLAATAGGANTGVVTAASLTPGDLRVLAALVTDIERHYGSPQDVEWCHDGSQFWIVQSRPVTTAPATRAARRTSPAAPRTSHVTEVEWTRANLAEVLPDQISPQALRAYVELLNVGERAFFGRLMAPESELGPIVKAFHGRLYFNLSQLRHVIETIGRAPADMLRSFGHSEAIRPEDEIATRPPLGRLLRALPDLIRLVVNTLRAGAIFRAHQEQTTALLARVNAHDPRTLSDRDIAAIFDWWAAEAPKTMKAVFVMGSVQIFEDVIRAACKTAGFSFDRLVYPQLAAGERSVSSQQAFDLVALAEVARHDPAARAYLLTADGAFAGWRAALVGTTFLDRFVRFLEQYGHRGRYESDWALPRLHEDPAPVLFAIRSHLHGPPQDADAIVRRQDAEAAAAWREFEGRLTLWQRWTVLPGVRWTLRRLKQQYLWREQVRSDLTRVVSRLRAWHLALAERFVERGWIDRRDDYFLLEIEEVQDAARDPVRGPGLRAIAARRAAQLAAERDLRLPLLMRESELAARLAARSGADAPPSPQAEDGDGGVM